MYHIFVLGSKPSLVWCIDDYIHNPTSQFISTGYTYMMLMQVYSYLHFGAKMCFGPWLTLFGCYLVTLVVLICINFLVLCVVASKQGEPPKLDVLTTDLDPTWKMDGRRLSDCLFYRWWCHKVHDSKSRPHGVSDHIVQDHAHVLSDLLLRKP